MPRRGAVGEARGLEATPEANSQKTGNKHKAAPREGPKAGSKAEAKEGARESPQHTRCKQRVRCLTGGKANEGMRIERSRGGRTHHCGEGVPQS